MHKTIYMRTKIGSRSARQKRCSPLRMGCKMRLYFRRGPHFWGRRSKVQQKLHICKHSSIFFDELQTFGHFFLIYANLFAKKSSKIPLTALLSLLTSVPLSFLFFSFLFFFLGSPAGFHPASPSLSLLRPCLFFRPFLSLTALSLLFYFLLSW